MATKSLIYFPDFIFIQTGLISFYSFESCVCVLGGLYKLQAYTRVQSINKPGSEFLESTWWNICLFLNKRGLTIIGAKVPWRQGCKIYSQILNILKPC